MMQIGIVGKPNVGKTTFFNAAAAAEAEVANYPFTTIDANRGVMYARAPCPCAEFALTCHPHNARCVEGTRYIPIEAIDVAGLVPRAHEGRGLGNKFLDDLRQASCLIHIVDVSGSTDDEGHPCEAGTHDPAADIRFLEEEIDFWIRGLLQKDWHRMSMRCKLEGIKIEKMLAEKLTGLGISEAQIKGGLRKADLPDNPTTWEDGHLLTLASHLRRESKPIILALNKADKADDAAVRRFQGPCAIPTSAMSELALVRAAEHGMIAYKPGDASFTECGEMDEKQCKGLAYIREQVLSRFGSTGIQQCIDTAVFDLLNLIAVYPVEDDNKLCDKNGNVLPDVYLLPKGSSVIDLAGKVHSDLAEGFIRAIDARTKKVVGADHELADGDIIHIVAH
jgi:hypothetical protein